jgi:hypothetical protein
VFWKDDRGVWRDGWAIAFILTGIVIAIVLFVLICVLISNQVSKHYDKASCHTYAQTTGRQTRFVTYTFWSWDCLTPAADGKWISTDALRDLTQP